MDGVSYYIAGDTDAVKKLQGIQCDVALVPIGGTYTMTAKEAAGLVNKMKPTAVIPIHYGSIVGKPEDADVFKKLIDPDINVIIKLKYGDRELSPVSSRKIKAPVPDRQIYISSLHPEQELFTVDIQFVHGIAPFGFYLPGSICLSHVVYEFFSCLAGVCEVCCDCCCDNENCDDCCHFDFSFQV